MAWTMGTMLLGPAAGDPPPDRAHGIAQPEKKRVTGRQVARAILYLPRRIVDLAVEPIRLALWAYERYELRRLYYRVFSFDGREFALFPVVKIESTFGASAGARLVHHDLFRNKGSFDTYATYGNRSGTQAGLDVDSGWLGRSRTKLGLMSWYRNVPADRFYGIGDNELEPAPEGPLLLDPRGRTSSVRTRFEHERMRVGLLATFAVVEPLQVELSSTFTWRRFGPAARDTRDPDIADVYSHDALVGYDTGVRNVYNQARLVVDNRRSGRSPALTTSGWYASLYGGFVNGLVGDPSRFGRVGFDVQHFVELWAAHRILHLRAGLDTAIGSLDRIPFVDLLSLGGPYVLRGYQRDRFRDRIAAFVTAEYVWEVNDFMAGFAFVEPGRVWSGGDDTAPWRLRLGYGGGLQLHTYTGFLARVQFASSIDGGFFAHLNLSPGTRTFTRR